MSQYELAVLSHPDLEADLDKATGKIEKLVKSVKGEIKATDNWGKRKMAYTIKGVNHAVYVFYTLELPAEGVKAINDQLNITEEVIRFLLTKPDLKAIAKAEALKAEKAEKAAKRTWADDEEDDKDEE